MQNLLRSHAILYINKKREVALAYVIKLRFLMYLTKHSKLYIRREDLNELD